MIAALLFCSGAAGLAYEVLWARDWGLVYGTTAVGTAVVLAAYFAGLAVGAPLGARLASGRSPLRTYAALAWLAGVLAPGDGPIAGAPAPLALRRALLDAQRALLAGDGPGELRAYLAAFAAAPTLPTVRWALAAIARERRGAGDAATAGWIEDRLR